MREIEQKPLIRGPKTYKAARGPVGRGSYGSHGQKPAKQQRINTVDKKVKRVASKIMRYRSTNPGSASNNNYKVV